MATKSARSAKSKLVAKPEAQTSRRVADAFSPEPRKELLAPIDAAAAERIIQRAGIYDAAGQLTASYR